ncbi:hypothetical protein PGT21_019583 [Puccinia graminis f. sp. tritici]|uniref:Uncharacterized protein n=1 Tax=Puccinia graminis f. sp. tritici TaxID=56615 RepID=A0A5B0NCH4_PUCGR|nr:hypothetical protein PGT21_019583 [Puccinia graminis f. sp. tritici]
MSSFNYEDPQDPIGLLLADTRHPPSSPVTPTAYIPRFTNPSTTLPVTPAAHIHLATVQQPGFTKEQEGNQL